MRLGSLGIFAALAATLAMPAASAQEQQSFNALVGKGYEVRSVVLLPLDAAKRVAQDASSDTVVVTLQGGKSVAVCFMALSNWLGLVRTSLDNPGLCQVR